jgi:hypothetical protein
MQPRDDETRGPGNAPEAPSQEPRPRRFRIVKLEERIAPQAALFTGESRMASCRRSVTMC